MFKRIASNVLMAVGVFSLLTETPPAEAVTSVDFANVDIPHVQQVTMTRGAGLLIDYQIMVCVPGTGAHTNKVTCDRFASTLTGPQSSAEAANIKAVMLAAYCSAKGLTCAP